MLLPYSNLQLAHQNPEAEKPLILPIQVICNTSDELLFDNIRANSRQYQPWQKREEAHRGQAILCGSGPSLKESLPAIRAMVNAGGTLFAMNGAASYLAGEGLFPDYQVMIDARPETAQLVGPAACHLFGSQVHPDTFAKATNPRLWHLQIEGIDDCLPEYNFDYCLIGGAASVGNCSTCLAYVMGYRDLQIFGFDSSHRNGKGHAFDQPMNAGDPCAWVTVNGQEFLTSLTMKLQAEKFLATAQALKDLGVKLTVHGEGLLPTLYNMPKMEEQAKYELMWTQPQYREVAPGEQCAKTFVDICRPQGRIIDFGCGTGRGGLKIKELTDCEVVLVDFVENSRDPAAMDLPFVKFDLTSETRHPPFGDYAYCTDVLEHIPPDSVDYVIRNVMLSCPIAFFQISLVDDVCGALIGQPLHLSVHPFQWWWDKFEALGYHTMFHRDQGESALFCVSTD